MPEEVTPLRIDSKATLHFGRLQPLENGERSYLADIPAGVTLDTVRQPHFWAHHARGLKPNDLIRAKCEDGSWWADLAVMFVSPTEVLVEVYHHRAFGSATMEAMQSDQHEIVWKGPGLKFCVIHKKTGAIVRDRLYPKDLAVAYLAEHMKKLAS